MKSLIMKKQNYPTVANNHNFKKLDYNYDI